MRHRQAKAGDAEFFEPVGVEQAAAAEVGQTYARTGLFLGDQHVRRFQILMQHADAVRRGDRVGDLQEQAEPFRASTRGQRGLGPFEQVVAAVLAFEEERLRLKVPVDQFDEVAMVFDAFLQHARQGRLALQCAQALAVGAELVHAQCTRLRMLGQPDLVTAAAAEQALELEIGPPRHCLPRREFELARQSAADRDALDRAVEPVTDARLGQQEVRIGLAERATQFGDRVRQHFVDGDAPGPDLAEQFFLGHHLAGMAQ